MATTKQAPRATLAWGVIDGDGRVIPWTVASTRQEAIASALPLRAASIDESRGWTWLRSRGHRAVRVTITPAPAPEAR